MAYFEEQLEKAKAAGFAEPLARFIETDREGHHSFCYPRAYGYLLSAVDHLDDLLQETVRAQGKWRAPECLKAAADYSAKTRQEFAEIGRLWGRHLADRDSALAVTTAPEGATP